ncbi:helix-turn-helix domain-containing protein [Flavobacterium lacus]|uniref:PAS domain-containing protein n=1 Tax=Flavobacterium lacus TaxID=1353778 RepID=A0A328WJU0_9FLAO|nr:helix-turn-helix domain-containing protein [Flavobacterium lacus]RAR46491.1 PAS domain-containing protein [Flavobacterium lacus]
MDKKQNHSNIIFHILFQLATGKTDWNYETFPQNKEWQKIKSLLIEVTKQLEQIISQSEVHSPYYNYQNGFHFALLLTPNFTIMEYNHKLPNELGYKPKEVQNNKLADLLHNNQTLPIPTIKKILKQKKELQLLLTFRTKQQKVITANCTLILLPGSATILLIAIKTIQKEIWDILQLDQNANRTDAEIIQIQKVSQFILSQLHLPLPTTREIATQFQTNEFTLKKLFRDHLHTSIYQFYNHERLKNAHELIQQTNLSLVEIALHCGFNDYHSFATAFKKKYHYPPSQVKRPE